MEQPSHKEVITAEDPNRDIITPSDLSNKRMGVAQEAVRSRRNSMNEGKGVFTNADAML